MTKLHENIIKPTVLYRDLPEDAQAVIKGLIEGFLKQKPFLDACKGLFQGDKKSLFDAAVELFEEGLLRIVTDETKENFYACLFDFETGEYRRI